MIIGGRYPIASILLEREILRMVSMRTKLLFNVIILYYYPNDLSRIMAYSKKLVLISINVIITFYDPTNSEIQFHFSIDSNVIKSDFLNRI